MTVLVVVDTTVLEYSTNTNISDVLIIYLVRFWSVLDKATT